jgi:ribonuclease P protein component
MDRDMDRLKKRREFLRAAKARKAVRAGLVLQARRRSAEGAVRVGFTATKKIGNAVARNFAKRRLREAAAHVITAHGRQGFDYVLVARRAVLTRKFTKLVGDLEAAIAEIHRGNGNAVSGSRQPA